MDGADYETERERIMDGFLASIVHAWFLQKEKTLSEADQTRVNVQLNNLMLTARAWRTQNFGERK